VRHGAIDRINKKRKSETLSTHELYRPSGRPLSEKLVPNFAIRGFRVVSATDPYGR
jgi:hypothetical protein